MSGPGTDSRVHNRKQDVNERDVVARAGESTA